jgi:hypothetical protein
MTRFFDTCRSGLLFTPATATRLLDLISAMMLRQISGMKLNIPSLTL